MTESVPTKLIGSIREVLGNKGLDSFLAMLGRPPHPSAGGRSRLLIAAYGLTFEWHPVMRRVYVQNAPRPSDGKIVGEVIAFDIETHGDAINAANIYGRGYTKGLARGAPQEYLLNLG